MSSTWIGHFKELASIALPISFAAVASGGTGTLGVLFVGSFLGTHHVGALGMSTMLVNILCRSLFVGIGIGVVPILSQARGAGNKSLFNATCWRLAVIFLAMSPIMLFMFWSVEPILVALGQPPELARLTGVFLRYRSPCILFLGLLVLGNRIVAPLYVTKPLMLSSAISFVLLAIMFTIALTAFEPAFESVPICLNLFDFTSWVLLCVFCWREKAMHEGWVMGPPSIADMLAVTEYVKLITAGINGGLQLWAEWWSGEAMLLFAGVLGLASASANAALYQLVVISFMLPLGFSIAGSVVIGRALGSGNPRLAKRQAIVLVISEYACGLVMGLIVLAFYPLWLPILSGRNLEGPIHNVTVTPIAASLLPPLSGSAPSFNGTVTPLPELSPFEQAHHIPCGYVSTPGFDVNDDITTQVRAIMTRCVPLLCMYIFLDGGKAGTQALTRGTKRMGFGALVTLASYGIGIPLGVVLAFDFIPGFASHGICIRGAGLGLVGLWLGLVSCVIVLALVIFSWMYRLDFNLESAKALRRSKPGTELEILEGECMVDIALDTNEPVLDGGGMSGVAVGAFIANAEEAAEDFCRVLSHKSDTRGADDENIFADDAVVSPGSSSPRNGSLDSPVYLVGGNNK